MHTLIIFILIVLVQGYLLDVLLLRNLQECMRLIQIKVKVEIIVFTEDHLLNIVLILHLLLFILLVLLGQVLLLIKNDYNLLFLLASSEYTSSLADKV